MHDRDSAATDLGAEATFPGGALPGTRARPVPRPQHRFDALAHLVSEVVVIVDRELRVTYVSPSVQQVLGYPPAAWMGRRTAELIHPGDIGDATTAAGRVRRGVADRYITTVRVRHFDGSWRWMEICGTNRLADPEIGGIVNTLRDVTDRRRLETRLRHQAEHDELTSLPNRNTLRAELSRALASAHPDRQVAVLFFDLDRFKVVNDSLGHGAGDRLLTEVARRLGRAVRVGDLAGRFGGDEFVVVCPGVGGVAEAAALADRLRDQVGGRFDLYGDELHLGLSVGVALSDGSHEPDEVLRDADAALYAAKARGRDRVEVFDQELRDRAVSRLEVEQSLRRALELDELRLVYQPLLDLERGTVQAVEALLRWDHPERGTLVPGDFLEVAEETGMIVALGEWVLHTACGETRRWPTCPGTGEPPALFVNLSPRELLDPSLPTRVADEVRQHGIRPRQLHLEITEQALMTDLARTEATLQRIRAGGVRFAIDDFGTGHSSLAYLRTFPIGVLKIDRTFVQTLDDPVTAAITEAVISLAHRVDVQTVAEGIESADQVHALRTLGCQWGQGWHLAPELGPDELVELLHATP